MPDAVTVYFNGRFMSKDEVRLSPDDRGFLFADGAYEVVRSYRGRLFELDGHLARLARSLHELRIEGLAANVFRDVAARLIERNGLADHEAVVYLQVTRGAAPRRHAFPPDGVAPTVYGTAYAIDPPQAKWTTGVRVLLAPDVRWARCDIKSIALLPNVLANQQAKENGADEAVFVRDGAVTEGSLTNVAAVRDGVLFTYPVSPYILPGITRAVVLRLCRSLAIPVQEFPVLEHELPAVDELMLLGTTTEVMPIVRVNDWTVGDGEPGPVTRRLQQAFREMTSDE